MRVVVRALLVAVAMAGAAVEVWAVEVAIRPPEPPDVVGVGEPDDGTADVHVSH
jgi:hypothetical protein